LRPRDLVSRKLRQVLLREIQPHRPRHTRRRLSRAVTHSESHIGSRRRPPL
jgi:hypothetical protein